MNNWELNDPNFTTVSEIEMNRLGNDVNITDDEPFINNLDEAIVETKKCIDNGMPISIVGDYDVDGITSSSILCLGLWEYTKVKPEVIIPKRLSEGYGLNINIIDRIPPNSLMITVDNGIAAVEQIKYAKTRGIKTIILDHHQKRDDGIIPDADVVVDPSAEDEECYKYYCGAGLAYRFIKALNPNSKALEYYITLAGIGTVADVMALKGHNRYLVKESLKNLRQGNVPFGMGILLEQMNINITNVTESDYGYLIGPIFNAAGRLYDDGGQKFVNFITLDRRLVKTPTDLEILEEEARQLISINDERKKEVIYEMEIVKSKLQDTSPIIIMEDNTFKKGIVGILAGKLSEKYKVPSLIFAEDPKNKDYFSGSGRCPEGLNLKELLDKVSYFFVGYGGHAGAAGMTIKKDNLLALEKALKEELSSYIPEDQNVFYYNLDITDYTSEDMLNLYEEVRKYAPYGEGNQPLLFRYNGFTGVPSIMGEHKNHFKLEGDITVLGFNLASEWLELGKPATIDVIGTLSVKNNKEKTTPQLEIVDFRKTEVKQTEVYNDLASLFAF